MKYMTAREEDILTSANLIKQGVVLDKLFQSMIVSKINYDDLLVCDKNAIMIAARVLGYGKDYEVEIETPSGNKQKETIDLTQFKELPLDESLYVNGNRFEFQLPYSKRNIVVKCLTHKDTQDIDAVTIHVSVPMPKPVTCIFTRCCVGLVAVSISKVKVYAVPFCSSNVITPIFCAAPANLLN